MRRDLLRRRPLSPPAVFSAALLRPLLLPFLGLLGICFGAWSVAAGGGPRAFNVVLRGQAAAASSPSAGRHHAIWRKATALAQQEVFPTFLPQEAMGDIKEAKALSLAQELRRTPVPVPASVCSRPIETSYYLSPAGTGDADLPILVLLHGFDSSALEFRRLVPLLEAQGVRVCAVDILGWGFTERPQDVECDYSAASKSKHLEAFLERELGASSRSPVALLGTSLGAAFAVELAARRPDLVKALVLQSPQIYADGVGPMAALPEPVANFGITVLGSEPLRMLANQMSYVDVDKFATEDAMRIGRLHVLLDGWADSTLDYMLSGGISVIDSVAGLRDLPVLCVLGRKDGIVDSAEVSQRLPQEVPSARLEWVEDSGHVPHLEQPQALASLLLAWLQEL